MMLAILKSGTNKERTDKISAYYDRFNELRKEAEETNQKSDELLKYEERANKVLSLFEASFDENIRYTKDDFYVVKVSDIKKAEE